MKTKINIGITLFLSFFLLVSCNKEKRLLLPKIAGVSLKEIEDYSTIYIFHNEKTQKYQVNKNNLISSTNWLFNVDRRLKFSQAAEALDILQTKKESPNIHSRPGSRNYFSVADTSDETLAFIDFTNTRFHNSSELSDQNLAEVCNENQVIFQGKTYTLDDFLRYQYTNQNIWSFYGGMSFNDFLYIYQLLNSKGVTPKAIYISL